MPAFARFHNSECRCGGGVRVGPETNRWHAPYVWYLGFSVEDGDIGVFEGLSRSVSREDYCDIVGALVTLGLRPAMWRVKPGREPYRVMCAIPRAVRQCGAQAVEFVGGDFEG